MAEEEQENRNTIPVVDLTPGEDWIPFHDVPITSPDGNRPFIYHASNETHNSGFSSLWTHPYAQNIVAPANLNHIPFPQAPPQSYHTLPERHLACPFPDNYYHNAHYAYTIPQKTSSPPRRRYSGPFTDDESDLLLYFSLHDVQPKTSCTALHRFRAPNNGSSSPASYIPGMQARLDTILAFLRNIRLNEGEAEARAREILNKASAHAWDKELERLTQGLELTKAQRQQHARARQAYKKWESKGGTDKDIEKLHRGHQHDMIRAGFRLVKAAQDGQGLQMGLQAVAEKLRDWANVDIESSGSESSEGEGPPRKVRRIELIEL